MSALRPTLCVFAKPPRPGRVKTRLAAAVGPEPAAALAHAFLRDTWALARSCPFAAPVLATDGEMEGLTDASPDERWEQGDGDLGSRLGRILARGVERSGAAIAIGSDSPGLPAALLRAAFDALGAAGAVSSAAALGGADAVLGPADDGGFYLLGLRVCPPGLLDDLPWSSPTTFARTHARLRERGLRVALVDPWFDVDTVQDLARLQALLAEGAIAAPATEAALGLLFRTAAPAAIPG